MNKKLTKGCKDQAVQKALTRVRTTSVVAEIDSCAASFLVGKGG